MHEQTKGQFARTGEADKYVHRMMSSTSDATRTRSKLRAERSAPIQRLISVIYLDQANSFLADASGKYSISDVAA